VCWKKGFPLAISVFAVDLVLRIALEAHIPSVGVLFGVLGEGLLVCHIRIVLETAHILAVGVFFSVS
jgi:hypothetical protein